MHNVEGLLKKEKRKKEKMKANWFSMHYVVFPFLIKVLSNDPLMNIPLCRQIQEYTLLIASIKAQIKIVCFLLVSSSHAL